MYTRRSGSFNPTELYKFFLYFRNRRSANSYVGWYRLPMTVL